MLKTILQWTLRLTGMTLVVAASVFILQRSDPRLITIEDRTRVYTRNVEFDYITWTIDALLGKQAQNTLAGTNYLSDQARHDLVVNQVKLLGQIRKLESEINQVYTNPKVVDPAAATLEKRNQLSALKTRRDQREGLVEEILQQQVSQVLADLGLTAGGQPVPPVLYHVTPLPLALIISPRDIIRQDVNLSLQPGLSVDEKVSIENKVEAGLDVSALVVPVGGVGVYPTMVMSTTDLDWLAETISHEWVHNFLTLRPLGMRYFISGELRTMNETTASLAGKEIGAIVISRYYPEFVPPPAPTTPQPTQPPADQPPLFDFRKEMHITRVKADELLAEGKIQEAEAYMESRRQVFWQNGYLIRKLNQAYFAFYGAYADIPGGEAGADPVGPAVVAFRQANPNLATFLRRIGEMTSFEELQQTLQSLQK